MVMRVLERESRPAAAVEPTVVHIVSDVPALEELAAREFVARARRAVEARGRFTVVLGSDPTLHGIYRRLARRSTWRNPPLECLVDDAPWDRTELDPLFAGRRANAGAGQAGGMRDQVPWEAVHIFFSDEGHVGPANPDSSFSAIGRSLLAHLPLRAENVHRIRGEERSAAQAARDYERHLSRFFADGPGTRFDLVLLGLGPDGVTAALHSGVGQNGDGAGSGALLAAPWVARLGTHRITMTPELLSSAECVLFATAGSGSAAAVRDVLQGSGRPGQCPARLVRPERGEVKWILDRTAAGLLDLSR